jgi:hypothetical protein
VRFLFRISHLVSRIIWRENGIARNRKGRINGGRMKITFNYFAQIRQKAGTESEAINVADGLTVLAALKTVKHGDGFNGLLFDG